MLEQLEDELHRAARPPEETPEESPEALRQRRMASILAELKTIPLAPMEQAMLAALENPLARACDFWDETVPFDGPGAPNACEIAYDFLARENYHYRDGLLYERASAEYRAYLDDLLTKDPQTIIDNAYQVVMKADILLLLEDHNMELPEIDVLLMLESPLDTIYQEWLDADTSHMDMLRDTMDSFIEDEKKLLARNAHDENGEIPERLRDYYALYGDEPEPPGEEPDEDLEL